MLFESNLASTPRGTWYIAYRLGQVQAGTTTKNPRKKKCPPPPHYLRSPPVVVADGVAEGYSAGMMPTLGEMAGCGSRTTITGTTTKKRRSCPLSSFDSKVLDKVRASSATAELELATGNTQYLRIYSTSSCS